MQPPTPETTELQNLHVWVWNLPRNLWNQIHELDWETREIKKLMKSQNPGHYEKFSWNHSLLMKPIITKPTKPMKTTKPIKSQNSWNHETSKLWHLRKCRPPRSCKRFQVPCEQRETLNTKKPLKSQNLWNHENSNYNTYYIHLKPNTMNAMKPWILALALYCRSFHLRDFFFREGGSGGGGGRGQYTGLGSWGML